jgi:RNA polymerase sigma-70 factor, ECF subfamily
VLPQSDEALLEELLRGDMRAFDALYDRHARALFAFVRAMLRDPTEAEDVLHEAFMALLRERGGAAAPRSLRAWLYKVARNLCLNRLRARRRADRAVVEAASLADFAPAPAGVDSRLEAAEVRERLVAAVGRLPEALAEVYRLRTAGLSYEEVADALGVPVGTVKSRVHEMVGRLREEMRP